jgi:hypothetical protein
MLDATDPAAPIAQIPRLQLDGVADAWHSGRPEDRRELLRGLFERLYARDG